MDDDVNAHLDLHKRLNEHHSIQRLYLNDRFVLVMICMAKNFASSSYACKLRNKIGFFLLKMLLKKKFVALVY